MSTPLLSMVERQERLRQAARLSQQRECEKAKQRRIDAIIDAINRTRDPELRRLLKEELKTLSQ